jgi:formiminoglutamase
MNPFNVYNENINKTPYVISIPHSGTYIPKDIKNKFKKDIILPNMNWFLKELYDFLPSLNFTVIENNISRYVIDPNRNPLMLNSNNYVNSLVYERTTFGKEIYNPPLCISEKESRKIKYYDPYHNKLEELLKIKLDKFDKVYLIDLHSFASARNDVKENIIISNKFGKTSSKNTLLKIKNKFIKEKFKVSENIPFSGGYITEKYGTIFNDKVESIQIEIRYNEYIEDRYYGEEELSNWNVETFNYAKSKLQNIFNGFNIL